jgi:hypothetical protein
MADITIKKGEGKWLQFTITRDNDVIDLSAATFKLGIKADIDDVAYLIEKTTVDFDTSQAAVGIVRVNLSATDTDGLTGDTTYKMELKIIITADVDVDKSVTYDLRIEKSVIHD